MFWPQRPNVARNLSTASAPARSPTRSSTFGSDSGRPSAVTADATKLSHNPRSAQGHNYDHAFEEEGSASSPTPTVRGLDEKERGAGAASATLKTSSEVERPPPVILQPNEEEDVRPLGAHDRALQALGIGLFTRSTTKATSLPISPPSGTKSEDVPNDGAAPSSSATLPPLPVFPTGPENIYDPATGALAGVLRSPTLTSPPGSPTSPPPVPGILVAASASRNNINGLGGGEPAFSASTSDDMWSQLSKIRELQSELARMHFALDRTGVVDGLGPGGGTQGGRRPGADLTGGGFAYGPGSVSTSLDSRVGEAAAQDGENGHLGDDNVEDELARRKKSIGNIMGKVCLGLVWDEGLSRILIVLFAALSDSSMRSRSR